MKNKSLLLMMLLCFAWLGGARAGVVQIGETGASGALPIKPEWNYCLTQQIYDADEIGTYGIISAISFYFVPTNGAEAFSLEGFQFYMKNVDKDVFENDTDMVPLSASDKVWEGTFAASELGWVTITLDTPFEYDGTSNLLVAAFDPIDGNLGSNGTYVFGADFSVTVTNKAIGYYGWALPDLEDPVNYQGFKQRFEFRPIIQINITPKEALPYTYGFEDAAPFDNWTVLTGTSGIYSNSSASHSGSYCLRFMGSTSNIVVLPQFTSPTNNLSLEFWIRPESYNTSSCGSFSVGYMTDLEDASSFVAIDTYNYNDWTSNTYVKKTVDFDVEGVPANAYIAMRQYNCATYWYWFVDDVTVNPPCPVPTDVTVTETTMKGFTASFTPGDASQDMWFFYWSETMVNPGSSNYGNIYNTTFTIPNHASLQPETTYYLWVGVNCEVDDGYYWSAPTTFTTAPPCDPPTNIHLEQLHHNYAYFRWEPNSGVFDMEYKLHSANEWISDPAYQNIGSSAGLFNLEPQTTYDVRVKRHCNNGYNTHWVETSFTTPCTAISYFPWSEDFQSYDLGTLDDPCWRNEHITGQGTKLFEIYSSIVGGNGTRKLQLPDMKAGTVTQLVLPPMAISSNQYYFVLDVYRSNSTFTSTYAEEGIRVFASLNGEIEGATELAFIPRQYTVSSNTIPAESEVGWYTYEIPITYTGANGYCYIILRGESQYCTKTSMDNFAVQLMPPCPKPFGLHLDWVTPHGASFSWNGEEGETYEIGYEKNPPAGWIPSHNLSNFWDEPGFYDHCYWNNAFDADSDYGFYLRKNCGNDGYSDVAYILFHTPEACPAPTDVTVTGVTPHGFTASFTPGGDWQNYWYFTWTTENVAPTYGGGNTTVTEFGVSNHPNIMAGTTYYLWVGIYCDEDNSYHWAESVEFTTPDACPAPTDVQVSDITSVAATVSWSSISTINNVNVGTITSTSTNLLTETFDNGIPSSWSNTSSKPWTVVDGHMQSGNAGVYNSPSSITATVTYPSIGTIRFDFWSRGEGTDDNDYDNSRFYIDGVLQFRYGAHEDWESFTAVVDAGTHTFTWAYKKDTSVNPVGDYFAVDNVSMDLVNIQWMEYTVEGDNYNTFTTLTPNTLYLVEVQANCGDDGLSNQSDLAQFTTLPENTKVFISNGSWNFANNWSPAGAPTLDNEVILRASAVVMDGVVACANTITFEGSPTPTLTIEDGGQLVANSNVYATIKKNITGYGMGSIDTDLGYYLIASPRTSSVSPSNANLITTPAATYDLYSWNRTADNEEWRNYKQSSFYLYNETGYLYANQYDVEMSITGYLRKSNVSVIWTPPYDPEHFAFNLYGNPFPCNAHIIGRSPYYKMNNYGSGVELVSGWVSIAPMEGFFIESTMENQNRGIERDYSSSKGSMSGQINIKLSQNDLQLDNVLVVFEDRETEGVEKLVFNPNSSSIALPHEGKDYGALFAKASGELPISFVAKTDGSYTLSFATEEVSLSYLHLIDNMTGTDVDLLSPQSAGDSGSESAMTAWGTGYTFTAKTTDPVNRFKVVFAQ